jgi:hypothetical protein
MYCTKFIFSMRITVILGNQNYEKEKSENAEWIHFPEYTFFTYKTKVSEEHYWVPFGSNVHIK